MASATLVARMVGDAKSLIDATNKSDTGLGKLERGFKAAQGPALVLGGAIVGATAKFAQLGDQLAKMSDRTGFSTESLSELRFAADQSGASIDGLEVGVRRMQRTIVDADSGLKSASDSFEMIGVAVEDLKGLSPEQQFERLASAIADIEDPTLKAAAAQEIFGRQGTALIPLFNAGSEGMAALRQEARDLGIVMDRETAAKAERMNDAINSAQQALVGMAIDIGGTVAPVVSFLAEGFAVLPGIIQKVAVVSGIAFAAIKTGLYGVKGALVTSGIGIALIAIGEGLNLIGVGASKAADQIAPVAAALERTRGAAVDTIDMEIAKLEELERALTQQYVPALMTAEEAERSNTVAVGEQTEAVRGVLNEYGSAPVAIDGVARALDELRARQADATATQNKAGETTVQLSKAYNRLSREALAASIAMTMYDIEQASAQEEGAARIPVLDAEWARLRALGEQQKRMAELVDIVTGANEEQEFSWKSTSTAATASSKETEAALERVATKSKQTADSVREYWASVDRVAETKWNALSAATDNRGRAIQEHGAGAVGFSLGVANFGIAGSSATAGEAIASIQQSLEVAGRLDLMETFLRQLAQQNPHITVQIGDQTLADIHVKGATAAEEQGRVTKTTVVG